MTPTHSKPAKFLAWFAIVNGVLAFATPVLPLLFTLQPMPAVAIVSLLVLGIASAAAGFYGLRAKPWAYWLLFTVFLVQSAEYLSEGFSFSFIGPLSIKFGWGWYSPPSHFNINILAVVVCILAARAASQLTAPTSVNEASETHREIS